MSARKSAAPHMPAMQRCERSASDVTLFGEENSAGLAVCRRIQHQILHFIQRNASVGEYHRSRRRDFVASCRRVSQRRQVGFRSQHFQPARRLKQGGVAQVLVLFTECAEDHTLLVLNTRGLRKSVHRQGGNQ